MKIPKIEAFKTKYVSYNQSEMRIVSCVSQMYNERVFLSITVSDEKAVHEQSSICIAFNLDSKTIDSSHICSHQNPSDHDELAWHLLSALQADTQQLSAFVFDCIRESADFYKAMENIKQNLLSRVDYQVAGLFQ